MNAKKFLSALTALCCALSVTACSSDEAGVTETTTESQTEWTGDNITIATVEEPEPEVDISGQTITFLGTYDINPTNNNPERSVALTLYEDTYGAKVEYMPTTSATKFDDLATNILGGTAPDIFIYEWLAFPCGVNQGLYQPIDSIVDFSDPLWSDMKGVADDFVMNGEHYVAPLGYRFTDIQVLMYNSTIYENEGLDDPYELYLEGKWDWDAFTSIMKDYVKTDPLNRKGIAGWWSNAFVFTAGETVIEYDGTTFTNNIDSPAIEKAQLVLEDITRNELIQGGWVSDSEAFANDKLAFYGMGTWSYQNAQGNRPECEIQIVPFPKAPGSDTYYTSNALHSYMWVKGSEKSDAVKIWLECSRKEYVEESYVEAAKAKFLENNDSWTEEMYDLVMDFYDPEKFTQVFDYGYGISSVMSDTTNGGAVISNIYEGIANGVSEDWAQLKETYRNIIDEELEICNG